jgi:hypothetical protein
VHLSQRDELDIDGVTFRVCAAEPSAGIVTLDTVLFANGEPLRGTFVVFVLFLFGSLMWLRFVFRL